MITAIRKTIMWVNHVIDGDTIDIGSYGSDTYQRLRLAGINAPERNTPQGQNSRDYLYSLCPPKQKIQVVLVPGDRKWKRLVGGVYLEDFIYVNELIVSAGWARTVPEFHMQTPEWEKLVAAERWAKKRKCGIWTNQLSDLDLSKSELL